MRKMRVQYFSLGFTLIEILIFIVVTGLLMTTMMVGTTTALRNTPVIHQQWVAIQTARRCMEWLLEQRRLNGYAFLSCPSTPTISACSAPSGYAVAVSVSCTTWNNDPNYKILAVSVNGLANASLSLQIGQ